MAFAARTDLITYQPDIGDMGLSTAQLDTYVTQAIADVQRDIRNKWWSVYHSNQSRNRSYAGGIEIDLTLLTDSQWTRATVYRCLGYYVCPSLTKFNASGDEDRFQQMGIFYRERYEDEFADILRDGVEYDANDDSTISDAEKVAVHSLRLVR
jgi:hypothetical protein|tara:strand:+ start:2673 stop:3131 length:459 start_codon:yes stop_codon:yes gene_type:complete